MYEAITILLFILGPIIATVFWGFVFPFSKGECLISIATLAVMNVIATIMLADGAQSFSAMSSAWLGVTVIDLVIGFVVHIYKAVKNSSFAEAFRSGVAKGRNAANYQIGGGLFNTPGKPKKSFNFQKKQKTVNKEDSEIITKTIDKKQPKTEDKTPNMKKDSTSRKACYNCQYWMGNRHLLSAAGNFIEYEDAPAKCAPGGGRQHTNVSPRATCNGFSRQFG